MTITLGKDERLLVRTPSGTKLHWLQHRTCDAYDEVIYIPKEYDKKVLEPLELT